MARIRSIHPGLFTDEGYMLLSLGAKAAWPGIWTEADDHGVFEWKPVSLKARLLPADNVDMASLLNEMETHGLVLKFLERGKEYGVIRGFCRWQRPRQPSYRYPFPKEAQLIAGHSGRTAAVEDDEPDGLPQDCGSTPEKSAQMEEGRGKREEGDSESPSPATSANSTSRRARGAEQRGSRLPADWQPADPEVAFARSLGLDPAKVTAEFRDFWIGVPGAKGRKLDWPATFRNRCREIAGRPRAAPVVELPKRVGWN